MEETPNTTANNGAIIEANDDAIETILNAVPDSTKKDVIKAITIVQQETFAGPIPHPKLIAGYEQILPGSADRFMKMAEQQQVHRMELEKMAISSQLKSNERGQVFGLILSSLIIVGAIVLFIVGMPWIGVALIAAVMVVLVTLFIRGKVHMDADLKNKKASIDAKPSQE